MGNQTVSAVLQGHIQNYVLCMGDPSPNLRTLSLSHDQNGVPCLGTLGLPKPFRCLEVSKTSRI